MDHIGIDVHKLPKSGLPRPPGARFLGGWEGADMTPLARFSARSIAGTIWVAQSARK